MRVGIVSHTYVEAENRKKLYALARAGHDITVFVPARWAEGVLGKSWITTSDRAAGIRICPVSVTRLGRSPASAWWSTKPVRRFLADASPELVHIEEEPWSVAASRLVRLCRARGVPTTLFTWQNIPGYPPWPLSALRRTTALAADGWVAGNRVAAEQLRVLDARKPLVVLPQLGIDPPADLPDRQHGAVTQIGYVGRLVPEKGIDDLIAAFSKLQQPGATLSIIGNGPYRRPLEELIDQLHVGARVQFAGPLRHGDVASKLHRLDILVLPSRTTSRWVEQFGHVLVEGMAAGTAVVGSDSGAIPDVIGEGGQVFPEGDRDALCSILDALCAPAVLQDYRRRARIRAHDYTHDVVAANLVAFWQTVVGGSRQRADRA